MRIDPVVALMDELNEAYAALGSAREGKDRAGVHRQLAIVAALHARMREIEPTGVIGAAHLLREAAVLLMGSDQAPYGERLRETAARLEDGVRQLSDLITLRSVWQAMASGECGRLGEDAAPLIALALKGAARPLLLYRAVMQPVRRDDTPARSETWL